MNSASPLDGCRNQIEKWLAEGRSYRQIAVLVGTQIGQVTSERSIRRAVRRWKLVTTQARPQLTWEREQFKISGDEAEFVTAPLTSTDDIDALIRERGLDPEDWDTDYVTINKWGDPEQPFQQLKVRLKRKRRLELLLPASVKLGKVFPLTKWEYRHEPELVVFVGDYHAPYQDEELHKRFCAFLHEEQPQRIIEMGDLVDLPQDSRHPVEPEWNAATQECLNVGAQILLDHREACPNSVIVKLPGNHLERLRRIIIDRLGHWYGLTPAQVESLPDLPPIHDPAYLLRLDELNIECIRAKGSYHHAQYVVTPYLVAKHGSIAKKGSGTSPLAGLQGIDHSFVQGHSHRQSLVQRVIRQIDGTGLLLQAVETGAMCRIEEGLGYAPGADWSNGFATAACYRDGTFRLDLATYVDNKLLWRSKRY